MNWLWFLGGMIVAVLVIGFGALLWHFDKIKVQSWGHLILGIVSVTIAITLGLQLWTIGGFLAWCWKLPVIVIATMVTIVACDIGLHGDRTR